MQQMKRMTFAVSLVAVAVSLTANAAFGMSRLRDYCDINRGAPISERCIGFVAGVVELIEVEQIYPHPTLPDICMPGGLTTEQIILKTRPWLRKRGETCNGRCTASSFIEAALIATYPCKKNK